MSRQVGNWLFILAAFPVANGVNAQPIATQAGASVRAIQNAPAAQEPLDINLVRKKVVLAGGKEIRQSAASAKPGEILEEVATYTNKSSSTLTSLEATLPVPANTELVIGSVKPDTAQASIDGRVFLPLPLKRKVRLADGIESEQLVPLSEYRFLRWYPGSIRPASSLVFSARFKVSNESAPVMLQQIGKQ